MESMVFPWEALDSYEDNVNPYSV